MAIYLRSLAAVLLLLGLSAAAAAAESMSDSSALESVAPSIHDLLPLYGLPRGLLPKSVKRYSYISNGEFAEFKVELSAPCYVLPNVTSAIFYYEHHIKGKLSPGSISDLSGIKIKLVNFLSDWQPITSIVAHPDDSIVVFETPSGFLSTSLPVALFAEIPDCLAKVGRGGSAAQISEV